MGTISSVNVGTDYRESSNSDDKDVEPTDENNSVALINNTPKTVQNVVKVRLNHSLNTANEMLVQISEGKREHMGITIQYLVEENDRLLLLNKQMKEDFERLTNQSESQSIDSQDRDFIYGESTEQKLARLEKLLASERREKWSAIENSERTRVDLINCEKELERLNKTVLTLTSELEAERIQSQKLENTCNELKRRNLVNTQEESMDNVRMERPSLTEFKADLKAKREARQKALSAISQELNNLREDLKREKLERQKLERELELKSKTKEDSSLEKLISDNATLKNEIDILSENIEKLKDFSTENIRLKYETKRLNEELDSLNSTLGELKFEYYEEKRKHERTLLKLKEIEEEKGNPESRQDWEEEKERLFEKYNKEKEDINKRTNTLKEVVSITKQMLTIREKEIEELKKKLSDIEDSVKNSKMLKKDSLRVEYEKQLENIKHLRELYEERVRLLETEREKLQNSIKEKVETIKNQEIEIEKLNQELESSQSATKIERQEKESTERELRLAVANCQDFKNELNLINTMVTQMLLGPYNNGSETDLDKLTELLQENHDLITEMTTREDSSEIASVLPKLLLDLITQVDGVNDRKDFDQSEIESCDTISEQSESLLEDNKGAVLPILSYKNATLFRPAITEETESEEMKIQERNKASEQISPAVQEIVANLPKVWRVLMELLSHHTVPEEPTPEDEKQCYKNVETPNGTRTVISVSKTFIRLKNLILEKKGLQKELMRLKQLNSHLETRLDDQEKRLSQVQCELHKTWGIVGRMRAQHQQLHNHEKILRYELQEKRVMLSELKQELEYCRDKWERARQKNDESETEWKKLRREFAARKSKDYLLSNLNDSGESGFSDEQNESGEECENFDADRSSTQSPVDQKLFEEIKQLAIDSEDSNEADLAADIVKQSEENLKQTLENIEHTKLEECTEVNVPPQSKTSATVEDSEEEARARLREARDLRLKKLEEQCKLLVKKVDITTHKSNYLNNRLEELHEQYKSSEESKKPITIIAEGEQSKNLGDADEKQMRPSNSKDCNPSEGEDEKVKKKPHDKKN